MKQGMNEIKIKIQYLLNLSNKARTPTQVSSCIKMPSSRLCRVFLNLYLGGVRSLSGILFHTIQPAQLTYSLVFQYFSYGLIFSKRLA